jgi:outer membrane protein OmpA-like peptidoglycan-associated protein
MSPLDPVDDVTQSLAELRRMLLANDLSGVRRLVYFGQLDWLRERLEPRDYFAMRDRVNSGDMLWLRSRFVAPDIAWIKQVVQRGDSEALRIADRIGSLSWLESVLPADAFRQFRQGIDQGDLTSLQQQVDDWPSEPLVDIENTQHLPGMSTTSAAPESGLILTPLAPAIRSDGSNALPSDFYDDVFGGLDDPPRQPPVAVVSDMPPPARYEQRRRRRRRSPAWIVAVLMLLAAGALAYLSLRDSSGRSTTTVIPAVTSTVARPATVPTTVPSTVVATTAPPPTTLAPLATDIVYFAAGSTSISTAGAAVIDAAATKIKANPGLTVKLTGVADTSGSAATNAQVSQKRAQTVQDALKARGAEAKYEIAAAGTDATVTPDKARRVEIAYIRA